MPPRRRRDTESNDPEAASQVVEAINPVQGKTEDEENRKVKTRTRAEPPEDEDPDDDDLEDQDDEDDEDDEEGDEDGAEDSEGVGEPPAPPVAAPQPRRRRGRPRRNVMDSIPMPDEDPDTAKVRAIVQSIKADPARYADWKYQVKRTGPRTYGRRKLHLGLIESIHEILDKPALEERIHGTHGGGDFQARLYRGDGAIAASWSFSTAGEPVEKDFMTDEESFGEIPLDGPSRAPVGALHPEAPPERVDHEDGLLELIDELRGEIADLRANPPKAPEPERADPTTAMLGLFKEIVSPLITNTQLKVEQVRTEAEGRATQERDARIRAEADAIRAREDAMRREIDDLKVQVESDDDAGDDPVIARLEALQGQMQAMQTAHATALEQHKLALKDMEIARERERRENSETQMRREMDELRAKVNDKEAEKAADPIDKMLEKTGKKISAIAVLKQMKDLAKEDDLEEETDFSLDKALNGLLGSLFKKAKGKIDDADDISEVVRELQGEEVEVEEEEPEAEEEPAAEQEEPEEEEPEAEPEPKKTPAKKQVGKRTPFQEIQYYITIIPVAIERGITPEVAAARARAVLSPQAIALCRKYPDPLAFLPMFEEQVPPQFRAFVHDKNNQAWFRKFYRALLSSTPPKVVSPTPVAPRQPTPTGKRPVAPPSKPRIVPMRPPVTPSVVQPVAPEEAPLVVEAPEQEPEPEAIQEATAETPPVEVFDAGDAPVPMFEDAAPVEAPENPDEAQTDKPAESEDPDKSSGEMRLVDGLPVV